MTAYFAFFGYGTLTLTGQGEPERLAGVPIAPRFLELIGGQPHRWGAGGPTRRPS